MFLEVKFSIYLNRHIFAFFRNDIVYTFFVWIQEGYLGNIVFTLDPSNIVIKRWCIQEYIVTIYWLLQVYHSCFIMHGTTTEIQNILDLTEPWWLSVLASA